MSDHTLSGEQSADVTGGDGIRRMGHDIRNKLAVMQNSVYFLEIKVGRGDARLARHLDILAREITLCGRMVQDLMDMTAPKAPQATPACVQTLVDEVLQRTPPPEGVRVECGLGDVAVYASVDAGHLARALANVLVYQYATIRPGDTLCIRLRQSDVVRLDLIDSGPGLARDELARLLTPAHDDDDFARRVGLAVAERLVRAFGADWQMESRPGIGTRFTLVLPAD
jgi:signal transduction histidine kinase